MGIEIKMKNTAGDGGRNIKRVKTKDSVRMKTKTKMIQTEILTDEGGRR